MVEIARATAWSYGSIGIWILLCLGFQFVVYELRSRSL